MKKAIKQRPVIEKETTKIFINCKDTVSMLNRNHLKRDRSGAFHGIFIATGRTETAVTAEWNKFKFSAVGTAIHSATERWITTMDHFVHVFDYGFTWM